MTNRRPASGEPLAHRTDARNVTHAQSRVASLFSVQPPPTHLSPLSFPEMERWRDYIRGRHPTDWQLHDLIALHELVKLESRYAFVCENYDLSMKYIQTAGGRFYAHPAFGHMVRLADVVSRRRAALGFTYNVSRDALERFGQTQRDEETEQRQIVEEQQQQDDLLAAPAVINAPSSD